MHTYKVRYCIDCALLLKRLKRYIHKEARHARHGQMRKKFSTITKDRRGEVRVWNEGEDIEVKENTV